MKKGGVRIRVFLYLAVLGIVAFFFLRLTKPEKLAVIVAEPSANSPHSAVPSAEASATREARALAKRLLTGNEKIKWGHGNQVFFREGKANGRIAAKGEFSSVYRDSAKDTAISPDELDRLSSAYAELQEVRGAYEAEIAKVEAKPDVVHIEIPPYPEAGGRLMELMKMEFQKQLGTERGNQSFLNMEEWMETLFGGAGLDNQTLDVRFNRIEVNGDAVYQVDNKRVALQTRPIPDSGVSRFTNASSSSSVYLSQMDSGSLSYFTPYFTKLLPPVRQ